MAVIAFEILVVAHTSKKESEDKPSIALGPKVVLAKDRDSALILATAGATLPAGSNLELLEVLVRPFATR